MAKEFKFPDIGEGITEGEIVKWLVREGDTVEEDQTLAEVETDKAVVEVPSPYAGTVLKLHFKEKDIVKVGQPLVTIGETGESLTEAAPSVTGKPAPAAPEPEKQAPTVVGQIKDTSQDIRDIQATPKVRRLAIQLGIDIKTIAGSTSNTHYKNKIQVRFLRDSQPDPLAGREARHCPQDGGIHCQCRACYSFR